MAQQINLYQAKFRKPRKPLSAFESSLGLLVIAASVAVYSTLLWQKDAQLAKSAQAVDRDVAAKKAVVDRLTLEMSERKKDAQLETAAVHAEQQVMATREVMQLINGGGIGVQGGYSEQLRALSRQAVNGMWLTGFTLAANADENQIRGRTLDAELVPTFLRRLNSERSLQGQHYDTLSISTPVEDAAAQAEKTAASATPGNAAAPKVTSIKFLEFSVSAGPAALSGKPGVRP
jgi:hypothetical protein